MGGVGGVACVHGTGLCVWGEGVGVGPLRMTGKRGLGWRMLGVDEMRHLGLLFTEARCVALCVGVLVCAMACAPMSSHLVLNFFTCLWLMSLLAAICRGRFPLIPVVVGVAAAGAVLFFGLQSANKGAKPAAPAAADDKKQLPWGKKK